jgi:hypothetical protein
MNRKVLFWILFPLTVGAITFMMTVGACSDARQKAVSYDRETERTIDRFLSSEAGERDSESELKIQRRPDVAGSPQALTRTQPLRDVPRQRAQTGQAPMRPRYQRTPSRSATPAAVRNAPSGGLPALDEEVWVIVKPDPEMAPAGDAATPGSGALICRLPKAGQITEVPLPLEHTNVSTSISAYIASVLVKQRFKNPYESKIEAVYVFPLPQNAAVNGFVMAVG